MPRILFVGDSHMEILGPKLVARFPGSQYVFHRGQGVPRYLSQGWLDQAVQQYRPELVVVQLGGNDGHSRDRGRYAGQVAELLRRAAQTGARVAWVGPSFATDQPTQSRHAWAASVIPGSGVPFFDSMPITRTGHAPDGVHFTRGAYDRWAAAMMPFVQAQASQVVAQNGDDGDGLLGKVVIGVVAGVAGALGLAALFGGDKEPPPPPEPERAPEPPRR